MIFKTKKKLKDDIIEIIPVNESLKFKHIQNIDYPLEHARSIREFSDNGWTKNRNFRQIGCIPSAEFVKHPEWMHEPELITKWLKSEEGRPYRTVNKGL